MTTFCCGICNVNQSVSERIKEVFLRSATARSAAPFSTSSVKQKNCKNEQDISIIIMRGSRSFQASNKGTRTLRPEDRPENSIIAKVLVLNF